jgi:hypothetical protein
MKKILLTLFVITNLLSKENINPINTYHLGISHDGNTVSFGYDTNTNLRYEGLYYKYDESKYYQTTKTYLGLGIFKLQQTNYTVRQYYGARMLKMKEEGVKKGYSYSQNEETATRISGVFGFEYYLDQKISLGAEAEYYTGGIEDSSGVNTSIKIRYYFY